MKLTFRFVKRIIVAVVGLTILLIGIALLVLPGPAFIVIPIGLAVLASEFVWAKKLLEKVTPKFLNKSKKNKEK
ncbi:MAG: PGPGW domain-containing protein [bacterium]